MDETAEAEGRDPLQREADHRVKNTLQLISSLVMLHSRRAPDEPTRQALQAVLQRITAVSLAHRLVHRDEGAEWVDVQPMARELVADLAAQAGREGIEIALELDEARIPGRDGAPLALLINELVGNALRHAFPGDRGGRIQVSLRRTPGRLELSVADNGAGLEGRPKGFGSTIVQLLTQQLRGDVTWRPTQPGLTAVVSVPLE